MRSQAGLNGYELSVKDWVDKTDTIGLHVSPGRYGGTITHHDIAFEFCIWISPKFKVHRIKEYKRRQEDEHHWLSLDWNLNRTLAKVKQSAIIYASEADLLNAALFGMTACEWREAKA